MSKPAILRRSSHLSTFAHMGAVYLFHDLYGYILQMSPDVLALCDAFAEPAAADEVAARFAGRFGEQPPAQFVDVFLQCACLVEAGADERDGIWDKVPVRGRWNVWHRDDDGAIAFYTAWGERPLSRHRLSLEETAVWDACDGAARAAELGERFGRAPVAALLSRLVHHDVQALKLCALPLEAFARRRQAMPPYLTSTMPYPPYRAGDPVPAVMGPADGVVSPEGYYRDEIADADAQFDHQETTLSHLLRRPGPILSGRSYGEAMIDALAARGAIGPAAGAPLEVMEIGGGLGTFARAAIEALDRRGVRARYQIRELSPALARAQRAALDGLGAVEVVEGDVLAAELPEAAYDLIVANEMIGDLPAVELSHAQVGVGAGVDADERARRLAALGEAGRIIERYGMLLDDAPDPFYFTVGAYQLLERIHAAPRPGGCALVTEFGDLGRYPRLSTQLDHPELSIHFGHLRDVAEAIGFEVELAFVIDLIGVDRGLEGLATTRSYFRALAALLADHGVTLEKIGYTREMFAELCAGRLAADRFGEVHFERVEDRLMGLVPHEFKALVLRR
jgi:hypothetical protein